MNQQTQFASAIFDESMSVLGGATHSLAHICNTLLPDEADENSRVLRQADRHAIKWLANHIAELMTDHEEKWGRLKDLIEDE